METGTKERSIRLGLPSQSQLVPEPAPNLENATERRPGIARVPSGSVVEGTLQGPSGPPWLGQPLTVTRAPARG